MSKIELFHEAMSLKTYRTLTTIAISPLSSTIETQTELKRTYI